MSWHSRPAQPNCLRQSRSKPSTRKRARRAARAKSASQRGAHIFAGISRLIYLRGLIRGRFISRSSVLRALRKTSRAAIDESIKIPLLMPRALIRERPVRPIAYSLRRIITPIVFAASGTGTLCTVACKTTVRFCVTGNMENLKRICMKKRRKEKL